MPTYEYKCKVCEEHFDVEQSFSDDALTTLDGCTIEPSGSHQLKKVFAAPGIAFKGSGFYRNDARSSSGTKSSNDSSSSSESSSSASTEKTSDGSSSGTTSASSSGTSTKESSTSTASTSATTE